MRQDYENQSLSLSQKAEAWLSAYRPVLIQLTLLQRQGLVQGEGQGLDTVTGLDSHTWH